MNPEYVYCIENERLINICKCGGTANTPYFRCNQLSNSSLPVKCNVAYFIKVTNWRKAEKFVHNKIIEMGIKRFDRREWFNCKPYDIKSIFDECEKIYGFNNDKKKDNIIISNNDKKEDNIIINNNNNNKDNLIISNEEKTYFCNLCNYTATSTSGFSHHKKTQKHLKFASFKDNVSNKLDVKISCKFAEVVEVKENNNSNFIQTLQCSNCKITFRHKSSLSRHKKLCKILNDNQIIKKNFDLEKELMEKNYKLKMAEKEVEIIKKHEKEKSELLTNFMSNANNLLNKVHDNTKITTEAMKSVSMSALKYANEKF